MIPLPLWLVVGPQAHLCCLPSIEVKGTVLSCIDGQRPSRLLRAGPAIVALKGVCWKNN